jgi:uncharacterized protein (UPF0210 family)
MTVNFHNLPMIHARFQVIMLSAAAAEPSHCQQELLCSCCSRITYTHVRAAHLLPYMPHQLHSIGHTPVVISTVITACGIARQDAARAHILQQPSLLSPTQQNCMRELPLPCQSAQHNARRR